MFTIFAAINQLRHKLLTVLRIGVTWFNFTVHTKEIRKIVLTGNNDGKIIKVSLCYISMLLPQM